MALTESSEKFIDLNLLIKLLKKDKPEDCWFYKSCIVNDEGIHAKPLEESERASLFDDEWHTLEEFAEDIKLNLPCTYDEFAVWAGRNRFRNILDGKLSSETIKIKGMEEFNEKYESVHGYSFWGDKAKSDKELIEVVIDNQTLLDSPIQKLIDENNLSSATEFNYFFVLFSWKHQLEKEKEIITAKDYPNKKDYDDRVRALNNKIGEIDSINTKSEFENVVQNGAASTTELIERKKAISQIKASRNLSKLLLEKKLKSDLDIEISSSFLITKLLGTNIVDLIKKANPKDNSSLHCELHACTTKYKALVNID